MKRNLWSSSLFIALLSGCGYTTHSHQPVVISCPRIEGDLSGSFTIAVERALAQSPWISISEPDRATHILALTLEEESVEEIGYQYDRSPVTGIFRDRLIPSEEKIAVRISYQLIEAETLRPCFEKKDLYTSYRVDFVNSDSLQDLTFSQNGVRQSILHYSLGQLDSREAATLRGRQIVFEKIADQLLCELRMLSASTYLK